MNRPESLEEALAEIDRLTGERDALRQTLEDERLEHREFVYVASHDLQAPLRKLVAFGDRFQSMTEKNLDPKAQHYLRRMRVAVMRMQEMLDGLLAFSRAGTVDLQPEDVPLDRVLADAMRELRGEPGVEVAEVEIETAGLAVHMHGTHAQQVFTELLRNAVRYSRAAAKPKIRVAAREVRPGRIEVSVSDNGMGFDESNATALFAMFQRLHLTEQDEPGCGAGLAVCKRIVERNGGLIRGEGQPNKGATLIVELPRGASPAD